MSDTPRTDVLLIAQHMAPTPITIIDLARQLERELNAAYERIKRLEEAGNRMYWTLDAEETGSVGKEMWLKAKEAKP